MVPSCRERAGALYIKAFGPILLLASERGVAFVFQNMEPSCKGREGTLTNFRLVAVDFVRRWSSWNNGDDS